ncbi:hypothetical protein Tco_1253077 [Tanacetum coccineum]
MASIVVPSQANYVLAVNTRSAHVTCHAGHMILVAKALRPLLLYWPINAQGRKGAYKSMSGMPSAQTRPKKSAGKIEPNHIPVAILQMGYRHSLDLFPGSTRQSPIS